MKWEKLKPPEPEDPMCCCECDVHQHGRCCNCEDLDEACRRWLRGKPQGNSHSSQVLGMIDKLEFSMVPALVLLPLLLRVAALHFLLGVVVLTALPGVMLWYYYTTHRKKRRTLFFLTLALYSLAYMYYLFITEILPRGDVSQLQAFTVTAGAVLTIVSLVHAKRGPGFVRSPPAAGGSLTGHPRERDKASPLQIGAGNAVRTDDRAQSEALTVRGSRCPVCKVMRPPRAGHCRICGSCVRRLDHHCIWLRRMNSCVGQANHRSFLLTLWVFSLTSLYGISVVLGSLCPGQHPLTALFYCPGVYSQYSTALCFTCAWYSSIVTGGLLHLLALQVVNISLNVTEREAQLALRNHTAHSRLFGLAVHTGEYSRGFLHNWVEFLTMGEASASPPSSLPNLV